MTGDRITLVVTIDGTPGSPAPSVTVEAIPTPECWWLVETPALVSAWLRIASEQYAGRVAAGMEFPRQGKVDS